MRSIHSFRPRRSATSISNPKTTRKLRRLKLLHLPKNTSSSVMISAAATTPSATMHKRLRNLQRLVPGHHQETDLNHLFQRTADYISALQLKLNILKDLTSSYGL